MTTIDAVIYSFKNKNLKLVVDALLKNTVNDISITVYDQHPLLRSDAFSHDKVTYKHVFWDYLYSPISYKAKVIEASTADYLLVLSDDMLLNYGWDKECISYIEGKNAIVSGVGTAEVKNKDIFSLEKKYLESDYFNKTMFVSRDFIFGSRSTMAAISYPSELKYFGEDELISFRYFNRGIEIFSAPSLVGMNLNEKTLETKYKTFSLEHRYNSIFEEISQDFWKACGFDSCPIVPLPYGTDDVSYNPTQIEFNDLDSRKFISNVKAIY